MRRAVGIVLGVIASLIVLVVLAIFVITNTEWGHERVRRFALSTLNNTAHGIVRIGKVDGNLLTGVTVSDVSITDSAGRPFLSVDRATVHYSLMSFFSKRLSFTDVRLIHPVVVLAQRPDSQWNYQRIFPGDTTTKKDTTSRGFGSWIALHRVTVENGRVMVRARWAPADTLAAAQRDSVIAVALGGESRARIERVPGGFQKVMDFRALNGRFPRLRIADPDSATMIVQVATLSAIAEPFRPPAIDVRDLAGTFLIGKDSLWFRDARAALRATRLTAQGTYQLASGDLAMRLHGDTVALADLRALYTPLPSEGGGSLDLALTMTTKRSDFLVRNAELVVERASITGDFGLAIGDTLRVHDTDLHFANLDTRLIERLAPGVHVPRRGVLSGRATASGSKDAMQVDGDVSFDEARGGTSRVLVAGEIGVGPGFRAHDLRIQLRPVQVDLGRIAMASLPLGGTITGHATINGSTTSTMSFTTDLTHRDRGATSRIVGHGDMQLAGRDKALTVELRALPLSLATVGRFAPAVGLRGQVSGPVRVHGKLSDLLLAVDLRLPDGGALTTNGRLDLASKEKGYDITLAANVFNTHAVLERAPSTALTATASARGRGFAPATMNAALAADVSRSTIDSVGVDSAHVRVAIANGLATVDSTSVRTSFALAQVNGTMGLAADRDGELTYRVLVDSLSAIKRYLPQGDTGSVQPSPARVLRARAAAIADSMRLAEATAVARAATGSPPAPPLRVDSIAPVPADSIAGSVYAAGTVRGNITRFDLRGRAAFDSILARGNTVQRGRAEYAWTAARTPEQSFAVGAAFDSVQAVGLGLDSIDVRAFYQNSGGHVDLLVSQDTGIVYGARGDFVLRPEQNELRLADLSLRFDTTLWRSTHPSSVHWGRSGIDVRAVELRSGGGGRIYINGLIPTEGAANLEVAVQGLQIADVVALAQQAIPATGIVSLGARLEGTQANPRLHGALGLTALSYRGTPVPDLRTAFDYADRELTAKAEVLQDRTIALASTALASTALASTALASTALASTALATVTARVPINLALSGVTGSRLLDEPMSADVQLAGLPLDVLPKFTEAVSDIRGRVIGVVAVRGPVRKPRVSGALELDLGSLRLVANGVRMRDIAASLRMTGDSVLVDSLVAYAGGPIHVHGAIDIRDIAKPGFALQLAARDALVLDNAQGRIHANADIAVNGPFDAVHIAGEATVVNGVIYIPDVGGKKVISAGDPALFNVIDTSVVAVRELLPGQSPLLENLTIDVAVRISRDTWARSADGNIELFTPPDAGPLSIHVNRRQKAITLEGVVSTDRGEYTVVGHRFQISRGSVTFIGDPEINPLLQLTGEYEVKLPGREALDIAVIIGGTLQNPRITLQSNSQPPISQTDLLSYLAFGRSGSSLLQQEGGTTLSGASSASGGLVGSVAAAATRQLTSAALSAAVQSATAEASRSLGLDQVNITPADLPIEATSQGLPFFSLQGLQSVLRGTQFEVGKYVNRQTFIGAQVTPADAVPGIRYQSRLGNGFRLEAAFEPRFLSRPATLSGIGTPISTGVFGMFLIREWRF